MKEKDIIVKVKLVTFNALIEIVQDSIFKDNPEADRSTHPFEMPFLDNLIEMKNKAIQESK